MTGIDDFVEFATWHVVSDDVDPAYPILGALYDRLELSDEERLSFTIMYVAYYNLTSALTAWLDGNRVESGLNVDKMHKLPFATERRGHRSANAFHNHLSALASIRSVYGSWHSFLFPVGGTPPREAWMQLQDALRSIPGNGRWAAYKTGEILATVHKWPVEPTDAGHDFSSGPRKGLADLYPEVNGWPGNDPGTLNALNALTDRLVKVTGHRVEVVETNLCDWHSLVQGHYYVGHDIDQQYEQIVRGTRTDVGMHLLACRKTVFDPMWMCEHHDWKGVRVPLNSAYRDHGTIQWWQS